MPDYAVSTAFLGKDGGITKLFEVLGRAADNWGDRGSKSFDRVGQGADRASSAMDRVASKGSHLGAIMKGIIGADIIRGGFEKVKEGLGTVVSDFIHFDHDMANAMVRFEDVGPKAADFKDRLGEAEHAVRKLGITSKFSFGELARGYEQIGRSKLFSSKDGIGALVPLMHLNIDAQGDFGQSTKDILSTMGAWAMNTDTTGNKLKVLTDLTDLFAQGQSEALMTVSEMAESMHTIGPVARMMGADIKDVTAMTLLLAKAGITGDKAGMSLKNIFLHFTDSKSRGIMKELGVDLIDKKTGQFRRMTNILGDLDKVLKRRFNPADRTTLFAAMAGMRGVVGGADLVRQLDEFGKIRASLENIQGRGGEIAAVMQETPQAKLERLRNKLEEKGFEIIDKYGDRFDKWIDKTAAAVDAFDMGPINQALSTTANILGILYDIVKPFLPALPWIVAYWGLWNVALKVTAGMKIAYVVWEIGAAMVAGLGPTTAMATAMSALGAALLTVAAPVLAMAAIGGIGAALYSGFTGKDNLISQIAQNLGIVPKLGHDDQGHVTGSEPVAPNATEAKARAAWKGRLDIAGAPPGSTLNGAPVGSPAGHSFDARLLGVNP